MATDKRLDQVSTLTDFDYALIVKGDQVAKASKQQLAELVGNLLYGATNASSLATVVAEQMGYKPNVLIPYSSNSPVLYRLCRIKTSASESSRFGGVFYITEYRTESSDMTVGIVSINSGVSVNSIVAVTKLVGYKDGFLYRDDNYLYVYLSTAYRGAAISYVMVKEGALTPESVSGINVDSLTKLL